MGFRGGNLPHKQFLIGPQHPTAISGNVPASATDG